MKLNNELLPHQKAAVEKLKKLKVGALFMEQGTGKTITALELVRLRYEKGKINNVIWLCPCSAKNNIKQEIKKQAPLELQRIFIICGIETLSSSIRANSFLLKLVNEKECFLIVDESLLIKNFNALRTKNILRLAEKCRYKLILNGTPISRNETDLFSQFYMLDWRILGYRSYYSFAANHVELDDYGRFRKSLNTDYLSEKMAPYTYQVSKSECIALPNKKYYIEYFDLTKKQTEEYAQDAEILMLNINEFRSETIYRLFSGLQAVLSGKRLIFSKNKLHFESEELFDNPRDNPRINALLSILTSEKTIIFCQYESEVSQVCNILGNDAVRFDGTMTNKQRTENLKKFAKDKKYLVANRACASYSLNLQFCHKIIYLSNGWDLGTRLQSEDRVHRLGQTEDVEIIDICAEGTLDERIIYSLNKKERILDSIKSEIADKNIVDVLNHMIYAKDGLTELD